MSAAKYIAENAWQVALLPVATAAACGLFLLIRSAADALRIYRGLTDMPKAPGQVVLLGQALQLLTGCPWELMHGWVQERWPIVHVQILNMAFVIVGSAEGVKRVFQTGQRAYVKDIDMSFKPFMGILGTGLVTAHGSHWQQQRIKVGPILRHDMLEHVADIACSATNRLGDLLNKAKATGDAVEMEEEFRKLTLQIIGEAFLSLPPEECDRVFPKLYLPLMTEGNLRTLRPWRMYVPTPTWFRHRSLQAQLDSYVINLLKERWRARQTSEKALPDLLEKRLAGIMVDGVEHLDDAMLRQLCFEFKTFLLAGHETSAAMLTWCLYELTQHPDKLAKVLEEARGALDGSQTLRQGAESMTYTLCALKETLRKYSVVPVVTRMAAADDEICGYRIPKGAYIACLLSSVHASWQNAEEWRPERFLPGGEYDEFEESIRPHMFVPFVSGPRNCLGQNFALLEARVIIGLLVQRFRFDTVTVNPKRTQVVIPTGPAGGMHMRIH